MDRNRGFSIYHAIKPGTVPDEHREKEKQKEKITTKKQLIRSYLYCGENSPCVVLRQCECLDACRYGQQYIKQKSEEQK